MIWAILYYGFTLGGPASATIGMRVMDLEMRTWYGAPAYFVLGAVHAVGVLVHGLVSSRRSSCWLPSSTSAGGCLHDILVGTVVINNQRPCVGAARVHAARADG